MSYQEVIQYLNNPSMTVLGTLTSIISFFMTIYVLFSIAKIRKFYIFNARVPEINRRLTDIASNISTQLNSFTGINTKISEILADAEVNLSSLSRKVNGTLKRDVKLIISEIHLINGRQTIAYKIRTVFSKNSSLNDLDATEKLLRKIHISLYKLTADCQARYDDARWEQ